MSNYWQDLYNREVLGLNNEGDAIGGEPAFGMKHEVELLRKHREYLIDQLRTWMAATPTVGSQGPLIANMELLDELRNGIMKNFFALTTEYNK